MGPRGLAPFHWKIRGLTPEMRKLCTKSTMGLLSPKSWPHLFGGCEMLEILWVSPCPVGGAQKARRTGYDHLERSLPGQAFVRGVWASVSALDAPRRLTSYWRSSVTDM